MQCCQNRDLRSYDFTTSQGRRVRSIIKSQFGEIVTISQVKSLRSYDFTIFGRYDLVVFLFVNQRLQIFYPCQNFCGNLEYLLHFGIWGDQMEDNPLVKSRRPMKTMSQTIKKYLELSGLCFRYNLGLDFMVLWSTPSSIEGL